MKVLYAIFCGAIFGFTSGLVLALLYGLILFTSLCIYQGDWASFKEFREIFTFSFGMFGSMGLFFGALISGIRESMK